MDLPQSFVDYFKLLTKDQADRDKEERMKDPNSITDSSLVDTMSASQHL